MVKAGPATDATIDSLLPLLDNDDILIDGGNTNYENTIRRNKALASKCFISSDSVFVICITTIN